MRTNYDLTVASPEYRRGCRSDNCQRSEFSPCYAEVNRELLEVA